MLARATRSINPLGGASSGGGGGGMLLTSEMHSSFSQQGSVGLMASPMRGGAAPPPSPGRAPSAPVLIRDANLAAELGQVLIAAQLADLTEAFGVVSAPDPAVRTVSLPELRAILRLLGCERVASAQLTDLQALDKYLHGEIRRPPLALLQGLELMASLPPPGQSLSVTHSHAQDAAEMRLTFDDFLRVLSRGRLREYLPTMPFSGGVHTLTLLAAIYELAATSAGARTFERADLMVACAQVNTHLSQAELDELWGILANADVTNTSGRTAPAQPAAAGYVVLGGEKRRREMWATLNETSRGWLQFREHKDGPATTEFVPMSNCVQVYHAAGHHGRREFFGIFGAQHSKAEVDRVTQQLHDLWNELDSAGDGYLAEDELRSMLAKMGTTFTDKKFKRWVKQIDRDKSGTVSLQELEFWWQQQSEEARNQLTDTGEDLEELWSEIDADGSGELDEDELRAVLERMGLAMGPRKLQRMMKLLDTDGNGTVSKDEFAVWWKKQSEKARSQVGFAEDQDEDELEAEADAEDESASLTIGLITRDPHTRKERHHTFECATHTDLEMWMGALQECGRYYRNYDSTSVSYGEFLLGMAMMRSTPLADRFDMFATSTRVHFDGTESQAVLSRTGSALVDRPVDDQRAEQLFNDLGAMEKFGVMVVKREQQKRDRKEMMERLQRANRNELHDLSAQEQMQMLQIERAVSLRCFMYGFLSALTSGAGELSVGWYLDTSDGMHAGNSYLSPNATCDADPNTCMDLDVGTMANYWLWAILIPIAVASVFEIGAIYWDSLRSAMKFVGVVGLQLLPLDDERLFIALSLTRAVLELGNPEDAMEGVLNPLTEVSKWRMLLCGLLYKARIGISNFVMKIGLKRVVSRSVARSSLPFVAIVGTAMWNGLTARGLMTEARVRAPDDAISVEK